MRLFLRTFVLSRLFWILLCFVCAHFVAGAQEPSSKKEEEPRTAKLAVKDVRGTQYVYLTELADAIGGIPAVSPLTKTAILVRGRTQARLAVGFARVLVEEQLLFLKSAVSEDAEGRILFPLGDLQVFCSAMTGMAFEIAPGTGGTVYLKSLAVKAAEPSRLAPVRTPISEAPREQAALRREPVEVRRPNFERMVIVIDAGHGGKDSGAQGKSGIEEKTVALSVAEYLKNLLESRLKVKVVLTRSGNYYLSADERSVRANRANEGRRGDLLVSLHTNASFDPRVKGICVYSMSLSAKESLSTTPPFGAGSKIDAASQKRPSLGAAQPLLSAPWDSARQPDDNESGVSSATSERLWDNLQRAYADQSAKLARDVADKLSATLNMDNQVVGEAPLRLLGSLAMPAVQVEIGYLSNSVEESFLGSSAYQKRCAEGIFSGIEHYYLGPTISDEVAP